MDLQISWLQINHKFQTFLLKNWFNSEKFQTELVSAIDDSSKINDLHNKYLSRKGCYSTFLDLGKQVQKTNLFWVKK